MQETILIVGDKATRLRVVEQTVCHKLRYRAVTAESGPEAVEWMSSLRQPSPDLVLLEITSSGTDGLQVIRALRACPLQIPIIVLYRYGERGMAASQAIHAGADGFLTTPVPLALLRVSIENALKLRRLTARVEQLQDGIFFQSPLKLDDHSATDGGPTLAMIDVRGRIKTLKRLEEEAIRFVLGRTGGSVTRTARSLGIGRSTLYRRLKDIGIDGNALQEWNAEKDAYLPEPELVD